MKKLGLLLSLLLYSAVALGQVAIVGSTGQFTGNVSTSAMLHEGGSYSTQTAAGLWLSFGNDTSITGETDFINNDGGFSGGFAWYNVPSSGVLPGTPIMTLNNVGTLGITTLNATTVNATTVNANLTGNVTGNVSGGSSVSGTSVSGTNGQFGNLLVSCNGCGAATWTPGSFTQGTWFGLNNNGGSNGETDFINRYTAGNAGGFSWWSLTGSTLTSQIMNLTPGGVLTVATVDANTSGTHTGAVVGNASTASALATTPSNCGSGKISYGISANGNALCDSSSYLMQPLVITSGICTTGTSAWSNCSFSVNWPSSFADSNYAVSCSAGIGQGTSAALTGVFISGKTASSFTITLQNGGSGAGGATTTNEVDCTGIHG
jgi:hypothetical protein